MMAAGIYQALYQQHHMKDLFEMPSLVERKLTDRHWLVIWLVLADSRLSNPPLAGYWMALALR